MKFIFQKKLLILSLVFFLFSCCIFIFLYRNINSNKEISQTAQDKWQVENTHIENEKSLVNSVKNIVSERSLLDTHFIQSSNIVPFLDTLEKLADAVGAKSEVTSVDISADNTSLMVSMEASGNFESIYKLVTLLENSPYDLEFTSVDIKNSEALDTTVSKDNKTQQWGATFQIKLLSFVNK